MADETDPFAEAESRWKRLFEELAAAPVVEVLGVVGPGGVSGCANQDESWTLQFSFDAWRIGKAELQTKELTICRKGRHEDFDTFRPLIRPDTTLRIRARVAEHSIFGTPHALLDSVIGPDTSDQELNDRAKQLRKPVTYKDTILGTFTLDRVVNWFTAETVWDGNPISLNLEAKEPADIEKALTTAHSLWQAHQQWDQRVRDYAVRELLALKNENWLEEGELELTADQFKARMKLEAISVDPSGSFEFWHNDGDLFWGHSILIRGNLSEGPSDAGIVG